MFTAGGNGLEFDTVGRTGLTTQVPAPTTDQPAGQQTQAVLTPGRNGLELPGGGVDWPQ